MPIYYYQNDFFFFEMLEVLRRITYLHFFYVLNQLRSRYSNKVKIWMIYNFFPVKPGLKKQPGLSFKMHAYKPIL